MEICDRLSLDQNASVDAVIACRERLDRHSRPETQKCGWNTAPLLEDIGHNHGYRFALFPVHAIYSKQPTGRHRHRCG